MIFTIGLILVIVGACVERMLVPTSFEFLLAQPGKARLSIIAAARIAWVVGAIAVLTSICILTWRYLP